MSKRKERQDRELEIERELRAHLELEAEERCSAGFSRREADYAALRALGNVSLIKEDIRAVWRWVWLEQLMQDVRFAIRSLLRNPGFAAVAVLSLALGTGANAAMFSIMDGVLLRPLSFPRADRLVRVSQYYPKGAVAAMQQLSRTMEVAGYQADTEVILTGQGDAVRMTAACVSANLFSLLGAQAKIGDVFPAGADQPGQDRLAILSHATWQSIFGGDPQIVGRQIMLDGAPRHVVGVMPADFAFPSAAAQIWIPLRLDPRDADDYWGRGYMPILGRLRTGANIDQARGELMPPHVPSPSSPERHSPLSYSGLG